MSLGTTGIGVPVRATITSFGPILLSKVLGLNPTQESTLGLIFHWADQKGLSLLDLKDLRAVISYLTSDEGKPELKPLAAAEFLVDRAGDRRHDGSRCVARCHRHRL
jgi:DNA helicase HerA-like ATPase